MCPPQLHIEDHSETMELCKQYINYLIYCIVTIYVYISAKFTIYFFFTAWGPNDSNFKLADDTNDRGECKTLNDYIMTTLPIHIYQMIHQVRSPLFSANNPVIQNFIFGILKYTLKLYFKILTFFSTT